MELDRKYKSMTSEQEFGRYNIGTTVCKFLLVIFFVFFQVIIDYLIFKCNAFLGFCVVLDFITISYLVIYNNVYLYKLMWSILILVFPVLGAIMFWSIGDNKTYQNAVVSSKKTFNANLSKVMPFTDSKEYPNCKIEYFETGEKFFNDVIKQFKEAKKSILIQVYIIKKGKLLDDIIEVLSEKVKQGLKVEIIFDSFGCEFEFPKRIRKKITNYGIKLMEYKPLDLFGSLSDYLIHRDHKKVIVIDGVISYTGGINIADEYICKKELHGKWKDGGIKVCGDISNEYLKMYFETRKNILKNDVNINEYIDDSRKFDVTNGINCIYLDGPNHFDNPVQNVFINLAHLAKKKLYIVTPYFIPNESILEAIKIVSKTGIDVKIIVPHIVDKKIVLYANRAYYEELIESGVKIYEYSPGFIHIKYFIADDIVSIGTANFDYRSIYFNQECMNLSYKTNLIFDVESDFDRTLEKSIEITKKMWKERGIGEKIKEKVAYFLAPLL